MRATPVILIVNIIIIIIIKIQLFLYKEYRIRTEQANSFIKIITYTNFGITNYNICFCFFFFSYNLEQIKRTNHFEIILYFYV